LPAKKENKMARFIVNALAIEDEKVYDTWTVENLDVNMLDSDRFHTDWDAALKEAKQANPDEWNVSDVIQNMEKKGWHFITEEALEAWF